jgi:alkyl sulfatase BDS1-like metallo-beta-lactamase superfamily hydrolase
MAAFELRNGKPKTTLSTVSVDTIKAMPISMYLDYMGICLDGKKAAGKKIKLNLNFTDTKERYALILQNSVLIYTENKQFPDADATLNLTRDTFNDLTLKRKTHDKAIDDGSIKISGQREKMTELMSLIDDFPLMFNIVTPN